MELQLRTVMVYVVDVVSRTVRAIVGVRQSLTVLVDVEALLLKIVREFATERQE